MRARSLLSVALSLAAALGLSACSGGGKSSAPAGTTVHAVEISSGTSATAAGGVFGQIPKIVQNVQPSVASVIVRTTQGEAIGSGVIFASSGTLVTNNHVVENATKVEVVLASGQRLPAKVKATDKLSDLAVITIDKTGLPAASFENSLPEVGQLAIAIGTPLGFEDTVTAGIVSGLHRSLPSSQEPQALVDLLQTDAAISPGNSGGALVDANGKIIGINVAFIPPQQRAVSIGFAIPAQTVVSIVKQLLASGHVAHAFLGIQPADVTPQIAQQFGLGTSEGVVVLQVGSGTAAAKAGLQPGDVIVSFGGKKIRGAEDLFTALRAHKPGQQVQLGVLRNDKKRTLTVTLAQRPNQ